MDVTPLHDTVAPTVSDVTALDTLAAPMCAWFQQTHTTPTAVQRLAWPAIAAGKSVLVSAPTGMGKTLAAFLPILGQLPSLPVVSSVRCLYLSPLKALGNDVRKTLRATLAGIQPFLEPGSALPRVMLRTGDTPFAARQRMALDPPDVLLTTPESLAVMLTHANAGDLFGDLRTVILDELHALAPSKRGADLAVSLERLERLAGQPLQRIGLSATCRPVSEAMHFLVGRDRACTLVQVDDQVQLELTIRPLNGSPRFLTQLLGWLEPELARNRSTLIFCNTRSLAERVSWALRRRFPAWDAQIAVHHSALAATRRRRVEREFKRGQLRAVVCSTSLELGIDIGSVDGVVLVHPPGGVSRLLQRVGRAGHAPGMVRRGLILTGSTPELLEATVTAASGRSRQFEPLRVAQAPLDVLCQQLLGMAAGGVWLPEEAYALVRRAWPFADLSRQDFDDCLDYLSGGGKEQWLPSRLQWLDDRFTIRSESVARVLRRNLGSIVTDEPATVRSETPGKETTRLIGEVDQNFAERLQPGDRFLLDGRCLEFRREERNGDSALTLIVHEVPGRPQVPRWTGEGLPLSSELARRLFELRAQAGDMLREGTLRTFLEQDYDVSPAALEDLVSFFERQESFSEIPAPQGCLIEAIRAQEGADYYIHNPLNRAANDALSRVVAQRLLRVRNRRVITIVADLGFALVLRGTDDISPDEFRGLLSAERFAEELHTILTESAALRERFQRIAFTGLMLLRNPIGPKRRVGGERWGERRLFDQVREKRPDFVLLRQAERELYEQVSDGAEAERWLERLPQSTLRLRWLPRPSPFVEGWTQATLDLVEPVESPEDVLRRLHASLHRADEPR